MDAWTIVLLCVAAPLLFFLGQVLMFAVPMLLIAMGLLIEAGCMRVKRLFCGGNRYDD